MNYYAITVADNFYENPDENTVFAGVLYLNPEPSKNSGTTLYKEGKSFDPSKFEAALKANDDRFKKTNLLIQLIIKCLKRL